MWWDISTANQCCFIGLLNFNCCSTFLTSKEIFQRNGAIAAEKRPWKNLCCFNYQLKVTFCVSMAFFYFLQKFNNQIPNMLLNQVLKYFLWRYFWLLGPLHGFSIHLCRRGFSDAFWGCFGLGCIFKFQREFLNSCAIIFAHSQELSDVSIGFSSKFLLAILMPSQWI